MSWERRRLERKRRKKEERRDENVIGRASTLQQAICFSHQCHYF
jgi:hypothetical protein